MCRGVAPSSSVSSSSSSSKGANGIGVAGRRNELLDAPGISGGADDLELLDALGLTDGGADDLELLDALDFANDGADDLGGASSSESISGSEG